MKSLRARIVVLSAVMALGASIISAVTAVYVAEDNLEAMEERQANDALSSLRKRLNVEIDNLGFEINDYANWDELYEQMPAPKSDWARINLTPGKVKGALVQVMITADQEHILGRFRDGDVRGATANAQDPAPASALLTVNPHGVKAINGIALFTGHPALYASSPVRRSDRQGETRGRLIGLAYLDDALQDRLRADPWSVRFEPQQALALGQPGDEPGWATPTVRRDGVTLQISSVLSTHDGSLRVTLSTSRAAGQRIGDQTAVAILISGLVTALAALMVGTWLGWRWVAPITALAEACREQRHDRHTLQAAPTGLTEADVLRDSLQQLVHRLRVGQDELAHALDRESAANAIHRRFLAQLGQEFGQPVRRIIALCEQMSRQGGHLAPEDVAAAKMLGDELEERFQEILGLIPLAEPDAAHNRPIALDGYLNGLADLLRPQAQQAGITLRVDAPPDTIPIDQALLSPVLVNLCVNALRAGRQGGSVVVSAHHDQGRRQTVWTVTDDGPGFSSGLAGRLSEACTRGEVVPGTPGIGMGLTLALANVRALGGTMHIAPPSGSGATIVVRLPYSHASARSSTASERIRRRH